MSGDEQKLRRVLLEIYEQRRDEIRISPSWLATQAMIDLDGENRSPLLVRRAAHLQLRQIARSICRKKFESDGIETEQDDLFPALQSRYPAAHSSETEPEYVLLEHLTEQDAMFNVKRLRREGETKLHHADALESWWCGREVGANGVLRIGELRDG